VHPSHLGRADHKLEKTKGGRANKHVDKIEKNSHQSVAIMIEGTLSQLGFNESEPWGKLLKKEKKTMYG